MKQPVALVTGGARGIGSAIVRQLSAQGFAVAVHYRHSQTQAQALAAELPAAITVCANVAEQTQVQVMFTQVQQQLGTVSVLVNNAGIAQQKLITDITEAEWDAMFATNVKSMFLCCKQALPAMISAKTGKIINISSMWGQTGASCEVHYSAAKAAVHGFTKALAKEVAPSGIQVNCIAPGVITTDMNRTLSPQTLAQLQEETPLGRLGSPQDIAAMAGFLASNSADFITGQIFGVNGGMVI